MGIAGVHVALKWSLHRRLALEVPVYTLQLGTVKQGSKQHALFEVFFFLFLHVFLW